MADPNKKPKFCKKKPQLRKPRLLDETNLSENKSQNSCNNFLENVYNKWNTIRCACSRNVPRNYTDGNEFKNTKNEGKEMLSIDFWKT